MPWKLLIVGLLACVVPIQSAALSLVMSVRSNLSIVNGRLVDTSAYDGLTGTLEINVDRISITGQQCARFCSPGSIFVEGFNFNLGADTATIRLGDTFSRTIPIRSYLPSIPVVTGQGQSLAFRIETPPSPPVPVGPDYLYRQDLFVTVPTFGNFTTEFALEMIRSAMVGRTSAMNTNVDEFDHDVAFPIYLAIDSASYVPEPGTALLLGIGLAVLSAKHRPRTRSRRASPRSRRSTAAWYPGQESNLRPAA